jgi:hypothetical protein
VAITYQPVTAPTPTSTRPAPSWQPARSWRPYRRVVVDRPRRLWTATRIAGLVVATALCVAVAGAVVLGSALFALLNFAG